MGKVQYRACLAITGRIQATSRERLFDETGLHALVKRRWRNNVDPLCVLKYNLVILMNINLDMVLVIQSILCVPTELKLKPLNISSCVDIFTALKIRTL